MRKLSHRRPSPLRPAALRLASLRYAAMAALAALAAAASGQSLAFQPLPEEAPSSLFDVKLGSAEAELLVEGSWTASASLEAGLLLDSGGSVSLADEQPLLFSQVPDLYVSFLLFKKVFAEIRVTSELSEMKYSLGYRGGSDDYLKMLRVGNDGISFPVLPFLSLGSGSYRSFGLAAEIGEDSFDGRVMFRYDQAKRVTRRFVGGSEVTETVIEASALVRGRWFVTPAAGISNLAIYAASANGTLAGGDGLRYRLLASSEYSYSAATGFIALAKKATTKVLAFYTGCTSTVMVTVDGRSCVLLYDPDDTSAAGLGWATLALGRYVVSTSAGDDAFVRDRATGLTDDAFSVRVDSSGYLEVTYNDVTDPHDASGYFRQPFAADMDWLYATDFSDDTALEYIPAVSKEIVVRLYSSSRKISIDADVVEGSVEVTRNGVPYYAFTVDASAGTLVLASAPGLDEEIVVTYLRESSDRSSGSLAAGLGGFFDLGEGRRAWTAMGLRWSVPGTSYAEAGVSDPGSLVFAVGEEDTEGAFTQGLALAGRWSTEAASGRYRIEGMESSGSYDLSFMPDNAAAFTAAESAESLLAGLFPTLMTGLHASGTTQEALGISAVNAGDLALVKYIDEVPASALKTFSFFARRGTADSASLTVAIDEGATGSSDDELGITIPATALASTWRRFSLRYGEGSTSVYYQDSEDDSLHVVAGATRDLQPRPRLGPPPCRQPGWRSGRRRGLDRRDPPRGVIGQGGPPRQGRGELFRQGLESLSRRAPPLPRHGAQGRCLGGPGRGFLCFWWFLARDQPRSLRPRGFLPRFLDGLGLRGPGRAWDILLDRRLSARFQGLLRCRSWHGILRAFG